MSCQPAWDDHVWEVGSIGKSGSRAYVMHMQECGGAQPKWGIHSEEKKSNT